MSKLSNYSFGTKFLRKCTSTRRLDGKTVVVTGANTGIGKECAKDFYSRGANVIMLCRRPAEGELAAADIRQSRKDGHGQVSVENVNLSRLQSVRDCSSRLLDKLDSIDILLNNAGVMDCPYGRTVDNFEMHIGTNHLGPFLLTNLLLPLLREAGGKAGCRVVTVSSIVHR